MSVSGILTVVVTWTRQTRWIGLQLAILYSAYLLLLPMKPLAAFEGRMGDYGLDVSTGGVLPYKP